MSVTSIIQTSMQIFLHRLPVGRLQDNKHVHFQDGGSSVGVTDGKSRYTRRTGEMPFPAIPHRILFGNITYLEDGSLQRAHIIHNGIVYGIDTIEADTQAHHIELRPGETLDTCGIADMAKYLMRKSSCNSMDAFSNISICRRVKLSNCCESLPTKCEKTERAITAFCPSAALSAGACPPEQTPGGAYRYPALCGWGSL